MAIKKARSPGKPMATREARVGVSEPSSFRHFACRLPGNDPALELFKHHASARDFPDTDSWAEIRSYLVQAGAQHEAMVGARIAWRGFRNR